MQAVERPVEHEASEGGSGRGDGIPERGEEEGLTAHARSISVSGRLWKGGNRQGKRSAQELQQTTVCESRHRGRDVPEGGSRGRGSQRRSTESEGHVREGTIDRCCSAWSPREFLSDQH